MRRALRIDGMAWAMLTALLCVGAIVVGTLAKVASEAPWNLAPRPSEALGISVAPVAHACGVVAGVAAWALVRVAGKRRRAG